MDIFSNMGSENGDIIDRIYAIISTQREHIEGNKQITEKVSKDIGTVDGSDIWMYYKPMDKLILFKLNIIAKMKRKRERVILAVKLNESTTSNIVNIVKKIIEKSKYINKVFENKLSLEPPKQLSINCYYVSDEYVNNPSIEYRCYIFEYIYKKNTSKAIVFSKSKPDILNAIYIGPYCKKMSRNTATSLSTRGMSYDGLLHKTRVPGKKKTIYIMGKEISIDNIDKISSTMMMAVVLIIGIAIGLFIHPYIFGSSSDNNKYGYLNNTIHNDILKLENVSNKVNNAYYLSEKNINLSINNTKKLSNIKNELNSIKNEINNLKTLLDNPQSNKTVIKTKIKKLENNINNIENNINNINNNEIKIKNSSLIIFEDFYNLNMSLKSVKEDLININKKLNNKNPENKQWNITEFLNLNNIFNQIGSIIKNFNLTRS